MATVESARRQSAGRSSFIYDPRVRGIAVQVLVFLALALLVWWIVGNTIDNLRRANISSGFGFLQGRSGFDIAQTPIAYSSNSTYVRALTIGLLNTLIVALAGIVTATVIGGLVGIGRLSRNWLIRKLCMVYVELFRNIPPLLVIFFWYFGVLAVLPLPRESVDLPLGSYVNSRGLYVPRIIFEPGAWLILAGLVVGLVLAFLTARWARQRQMATGQPFPVVLTGLALVLGLPLLGALAGGWPLSIELPELGAFNLAGGFQIKPEFLSLYLALSFYTASFIAEIVRAGILGIPRGQSEAAFALGLRPGLTQRLVILPQAARIIIPPLTSQYLNLTKNSSLAIAIGYPDLVAVGQTAMNQTGQAIEVVVIWMVVYLTISLATSAFMNWFNARVALVER